MKAIDPVVKKLDSLANQQKANKRAVIAALSVGQLTCPVCSVVLQEENIDSEETWVISRWQDKHVPIHTHLCLACSMNNFLYAMAGSREQVLTRPLNHLFNYFRV